MNRETVTEQTRSILAPAATKEEGQRQLDLPNFITRIVPLWTSPTWLDAEKWRRAVQNQPYASACRDTIIANTLTLDWLVEARDPEQNWDYRHEIDWYTKQFLYADDIGYDVHTEMVMKDLYDVPFGGASEIGRKGDSPDGRVVWIKHVDAGTLFPTYNSDFPVGQKLQYQWEHIDPIWFPKHTIARTYLSPRTEIVRRGWGMAPPERIYLALEMLYRGDRYYADLLLDVPEVGILDLGDMDEDAATSWVNQWRDLLTGSQAFKIPVLHSHEKPANFIQFGRSPVEMQFDTALTRYQMILAAGYGLAVTDVGDLTIASNTLAGSIRQERRAKRTGVGMGLIKVRAYYDRMLPPYLHFRLVDRDEELMVAKGRARLANSLALINLVKEGVLKPSMALNQLGQDGLLTTPIREYLEELRRMEDAGEPIGQTAQQLAQQVVVPAVGTNGTGQKQTIRETLRDPVPPSKGGEGDITTRSAFDEVADRNNKPHLTRLVNIARRELLPIIVDQGGTADRSALAVQIGQAAYESLVFKGDGAWGRSRERVEDVVTLLADEISRRTWWMPSFDNLALATAIRTQNTEIVRAKWNGDYAAGLSVSKEPPSATLTDVECNNLVTGVEQWALAALVAALARMTTYQTGVGILAEKTVDEVVEEVNNDFVIGIRGCSVIFDSYVQGQLASRVIVGE